MGEIVDEEDINQSYIVHDILHRIRQYRLKEEARTCVLSKIWSSIWRTRPDVIIGHGSHKS